MRYNTRPHTCCWNIHCNPLQMFAKSHSHTRSDIIADKAQNTLKKTTRETSPTFRILLVEDSMRMDWIWSRCKVFHVYYDVITHFCTDHRSKEAQPLWFEDLSRESLICVLLIHSFFIHPSNPCWTTVQKYRGMPLEMRGVTKKRGKSSHTCVGHHESVSLI